MWNDCWPSAMGWTFVDYYCLPKASYYSFKRATAPILLSMTKNGENYDTYVVSDEKRGASGELTIYAFGKSGMREISKNIISAPAMVSTVVKSFSRSVIGEGEFIVAELKADGKTYRTFYREGKLPIVPTNGAKITEQTENSITVTADSYIHAVEFEGEYIFEDNYFSMLPGESRKITFRKAREHQNDNIAFTAYTIEI